jgi:hypothetical protein
MAIFNVSNQLLQIDTGKVRTNLYNPSLGFAPWAGLGENQVLGQRYFGTTNVQVPNANSSPAIFMLVQYLSTSAITTANLTTAAAPAPVYWTDNTFTTITAISTEGIGGTTLGLNFPAGYMMVNTTDLTSLTAAQLVGAQIIIQIAGYLKGAYGPTTGTAGIGNWIVPAAGTFISTGVVAGTTAPTLSPFGRQLTALSSGLCDVLVGTDII